MKYPEPPTHPLHTTQYELQAEIFRSSQSGATIIQEIVLLNARIRKLTFEEFNWETEKHNTNLLETLTICTYIKEF